MSLELINTFVTFGTFVVIAATAIAAIVQLRHARSNHIAALNELRETTEVPDFQSALYFVQGELSAKLQDPAFRYQIATRSARTDETRPLFAKINAIGNYYENLGVLVKTGLIDKEPVLQLWSGIVAQSWENLAPIAAIARRGRGDLVWENFEYLAVLACDWAAAHPKGTYPAGVRRIGLKDEWLDADRQYAASLVPA
ncbi:MAG: hypothetical protein WB681_10940 [Candidatus Cybelea sp.]